MCNPVRRWRVWDKHPIAKEPHLCLRGDLGRTLHRRSSCRADAHPPCSGAIRGPNRFTARAILNGRPAPDRRRAFDARGTLVLSPRTRSRR